MPLDVLLRTEKLTRVFSGFIAVNEINFVLGRGELRAIIGPNGAGKTTFFKLLSGELRPSSGEVWFKGRRISELPAYRRGRIGLGTSYQISNFFANLTAFENVRIAAQSHQLDYNFWGTYRSSPILNRMASELLETVGLAGARNLLASQLSYGDRRRLELGMALGTDPQLLLLDEPTAGMTPEETEQITLLIRRISSSRTIILVEHKVNVVMSIADRVTAFHQGRILAEGTPVEIRNNPGVQAVYFGSQRC